MAQIENIVYFFPVNRMCRTISMFSIHTFKTNKTTIVRQCQNCLCLCQNCLSSASHSASDKDKTLTWPDHTSPEGSHETLHRNPMMSSSAPLYHHLSVYCPSLGSGGDSPASLFRLKWRQLVKTVTAEKPQRENKKNPHLFSQRFYSSSQAVLRESKSSSKVLGFIKTLR